MVLDKNQLNIPQKRVNTIRSVLLSPKIVIINVYNNLYVYSSVLSWKYALKCVFLAKRAKKYSEGLNRMHPMDLTDISISKSTFKSCATMILKKAFYLLGYI